MRLFLVSLLILFAEVMSIRWFSIEYPLIQIFPNLVLTTAFVGMSAGLATYQKPYTSQSLLIAVVSASLLCLMFVTRLHLDQLSLGHGGTVLLSIGFIAFVVVNLTIIFSNLGRLLGLEFSRFPSLHAYSINVLGSLAGVALFAVISWLWLSPAVWILMAAALTFALVRSKWILAYGLGFAAIAAFAHQGSTWTPYGRIHLNPIHELDATLGPGNCHVVCNNSLSHDMLRIVPHVSAEDTRKNYGPAGDNYYTYRTWLELPYLMAPSHANVLILGSGSGNDVHLALLHGAEHIDAVDRDPFMLHAGKNLHPNKAYQNPKVSFHLGDARTFLRRSDQKYDLIQFTFLDTGGTLRLSSFLRSDNFVYTKESFQSALKLLKPNGLVTLSFACPINSVVPRRLYKTITDAWGQPPVTYAQDPWGPCYFFFGPGATTAPAILKQASPLREFPKPGEYSENEPTASDDWPFLYTDTTETAVTSAWTYFLIVGAAAIVPLSVLRKGLSGTVSSGLSWSMFFLGVAFMLVEVKSITKLSLAFGATWIVSSIVIGVILVLAFISNFLVQRFQLRNPLPCYLGIAVMCLIDFFVNVPELTASLPTVVSGPIQALFACSPIFFGGMIFSILLSRAETSVLLLAANILGVAVGALLENLCVFLGINFLSLVALALYLISAVPLMLSRPGQAQPSVSGPSG